jgi:hypothetical protein
LENVTTTAEKKWGGRSNKRKGQEIFNVKTPSNKKRKATGANQKNFTIVGGVYTRRRKFHIFNLSRVAAYKVYIVVVT